MDTVSSLDLFLKPQSVAVIGATGKTGKGSFNIAQHLLEMGFKGQIYPVNPRIDSLLGLKVYQSVSELPLGIDLAIVMVPREAVAQVLSDAGDRGIRAFIIITEGFAEADDKGKALQSEIVAIAREKGLRIMGPNSLGVINSFHNFSSSFVAAQQRMNPVAFVCQSGGFLEGFSGFSPGKSIDLGNMCDVDFVETLRYLQNDSETKVIALHIEGLQDGKRFLQVAAKVQRQKPVVVLKTGRSERSALAASSHTGSLTGKDVVYRAAFKQAGLIQADTIDDLSDYTRAFINLPPPKGNRVAILTPTGAGATMCLDAMEQYHFELAKLSEKTINAIKDFLPTWSPPRNPVDVMAAALRHGYKTVYKATLEALLKDDNVDVVLCIAGFPTLRTIQAASNKSDKPVATWILGEWGEGLLSRIKETGYEAVYPGPERAFRALAALLYYSVKS